MKKIVVYGTGGFGREVMCLLSDINLVKKEWDIIGFVDDNPEKHGKTINGYQVMGGLQWLKEYTKKESIAIAIGIGNPSVKEKIVSNLSECNVSFPVLVHPNVIISNHVSIGKGTVICAGNILTCNIQIGNFVTINLSSTVGHDVVIEDYVTILPGCNISGNVRLRKKVDVGTNTAIIQGVEIGQNTIIGAGSTVIRDLPENCTAVGIPAKPIKFNQE